METQKRLKNILKVVGSITMTMDDIINEVRNDAQQLLKLEKERALPTDGDPSNVWDFVQKYYPKYSSSDEIAENDDLQKLDEKEYEDGDGAHRLLIRDFDGDISNPRIKAALIESNEQIFRRAMLGYMETLKDFKPKRMGGFMYRDASNYKFFFNAEIPEGLEVGGETTYEALGYTLERFHEEIVKYPCGNDDHNIIELVEIKD